MKRIIFIMGFVLLVSSSFAQTPPVAVKNTFEQKFPAATNIKWGKESASEWEAEFKMNSAKNSANFLADGNWVETETEIPVAQLPAGVVISIKKQYPAAEIVGAHKIETAQKGTMYEADIKTGGKKKEVVLTADGTFIK